MITDVLSSSSVNLIWIVWKRQQEFPLPLSHLCIYNTLLHYLNVVYVGSLTKKEKLLCRTDSQISGLLSVCLDFRHTITTNQNRHILVSHIGIAVKLKHFSG